MYCRNWAGLEAVLFAPSTATALGGLTELYSDQARQGTQPRAGRRIFFHSLADISRVIDPGSDVDALTHVAADIVEEAGRVENEAGDGRTEDKDPETQHAEDGEAAFDAFTSSPTANRAVTASEDEKSAASILQKIFRSMKQRKKEREATKGFAATRGRLLVECLSRSKTIDWAKRRDRLIFLGALPHLLLSVDWVVERAKDMKEVAKKRRSAGASEERLEQAMELQTKAR